MNFKKLEKAFELMHNNPPPPFNPGYDEDLIKRYDACKAEYKAYMESLPDDLSNDEYDKLVDLKDLELRKKHNIFPDSWPILEQVLINKYGVSR